MDTKEIIVISVAVGTFIGALVTGLILFYKAPGEKRKTAADTHKTEAETEKTKADTVLSLMKEIDQLRNKLTDFINTEMVSKKELENFRRILKQIEIILRDFLTMSRVAYWEADVEGKFTFCNRAWVELTGLSFDESLGDGWQNCLHEDTRLKVFREWMNAVRSSDDSKPIRFQIQNTLTGEVSECESTFYIVVNADSSVYKLIGRTVKI